MVTVYICFGEECSSDISTVIHLWEFENGLLIVTLHRRFPSAELREQPPGYPKKKKGCTGCRSRVLIWGGGGLLAPGPRDAVPLRGLWMRQNRGRRGEAVPIPQGPWGVSQVGEAGPAHTHPVGRHAELSPLQGAFWQGVLWAQATHSGSGPEAGSRADRLRPAALFLLRGSGLQRLPARHPTARHHRGTERARHERE